MKKFYMILAALLIGSMCFAQTIGERLPYFGQDNNVSEKTTGWYGEALGQYYYPMEAGEWVVLMPESFTGANVAGEQVTKIKFPCYTYPMDQSYSGTSFTLKIYEGCTPDEDLTTDGETENVTTVMGNMVYEQNITATLNSTNEVELTTPYTIGTNVFWVVLVANTKACILCDQPQLSNVVSYAALQTDPSILQMTGEPTEHYLMYYPAAGGDPAVLVTNDALLYLDADHTSVAYFETNPRLEIFVQGSGAYVENSDISAAFFNTYPNPTTNITELTISATQDLTVYPYIQNNGPDAVPTTETVNVSFTINGVDPYGQALPMQWSQPFQAGYYSPIQMSETEYGLTFTAAELDAAGITGTFDVCITATYTGVDNNAANNTACLHVTRPNPTAVEENIAAAVSVYPNPANDMFTVANAEGATIVVVNSLGQVVANIENAAANQTIDASNFANGTYFVKVNAEVVKINVIK